MHDHDYLIRSRMDLFLAHITHLLILYSDANYDGKQTVKQNFEVSCGS